MLKGLVDVLKCKPLSGPKLRHRTDRGNRHRSRLHPVGDDGAKDTLGPAPCWDQRPPCKTLSHPAYIGPVVHRDARPKDPSSRHPCPCQAACFQAMHRIVHQTHYCYSASKEISGISMVPVPLSSASRMATAQLLVIFTLLPDALVSITCGHKTDLFRSIAPGCSKPTNWLPAKWLNPTNGSNTHQDPALSYSDHPMSSMRPCCILKNASCSINLSLLQSCVKQPRSPISHLCFGCPLALNSTPRCSAPSKLASC